MKKLLSALVLFFLAVSSYASIPVTRPFSGVTGLIPTADETQWAYNRNVSAPSGDWNVASGTVINVTNGDIDSMLHWTGDTFSANHCSAVVLGVISTNGAGVGRGYGPGVRMDTATTQKTGIRLVGDSHGWQLVRFVNATTTILTSDTTAFVVAHTVELCVTVSGANDVYTFTDNGTPMVNSPYTDSSPLTGGAPGVGHSSTTTVGANVGIDSWTGRNVPTGGLLLLGVGS